MSEFTLSTRAHPVSTSALLVSSQLVKQIDGPAAAARTWFFKFPPIISHFIRMARTRTSNGPANRPLHLVELGEHCHTHIIPRLKKVIDGADAGGITEAVGWKGGGGFRYYRLAPSLLTQDKWGNWIISKEYNAPMLAEAVCKLEGFTYAPSDTVYWQQGHSTERDFVYVTTASLSHDQLRQLSDEVGPERSLLVVCSAFRGRKEGYPNLTVKKIPKAVLTRCEWGKDDYSLKVENLPKAPPLPLPVDPKTGQQSLFDEEVGK